MSKRFCAGIVIALAMVWPPIESAAQTVHIVRESPEVIVVTGGSGAAAWQLRYGVLPAYQQLIVEITPTRAYFANGSWLRLIDTERGMVLGRWRFPFQILEVSKSPDGELAVRVRFKLSPAAGRPDTTVTFDPAAPAVPSWELGSLLSYRIAENEPLGLFPRPRRGDRWGTQPKDVAAKFAPAVEEVVKRDPSAGWIRLAWGKLLADAGDPRANAIMADAVRASTDFSELFMMSGRLVVMGQPDLAAEAYDRAYTDFLAKDRDPRLITFLISRLVLYSPFGLQPDSLNDADRRQGLERTYQLAPGLEGADQAWARYAAYLDEKGATEDSALWRRRAEFARRESLYIGSADIQLAHDRMFLVAAGSILAAVLLIWALHAKYATERRMRTIAATRTSRALAMGFLNLEYWSRRERALLLFIAGVGWLAVGMASVYLGAITRAAADPVRVGDISGPDDIANISRRAASPERDLLLAIARQTTGELREAEQAYRALPQFAESWNNLGVILARAGKTEEARQAFARALEISPGLPEAILNTGGAPQSHATEVHHRYVPGTTMIAIPGREHFFRAALGTAWTNRYLRSLLGPMSDPTALGRDLSLYSLYSRWVPTKIIGLSLVLVLALSLALLAVVPIRDVTQPPGRFARVLARAVPGVSPSWRWLGGPVLLMSSVLALALVLQLTSGSPYVVSRIMQPGLIRAFGLPPEVRAGFADINPPLALLAGVLGSLIIANWILIRRERAR